MPDRAIVPTVVAVSLGFVAGLAGAALQLDFGQLVLIAVGGAGAALVAGLLSVLGVGGGVGAAAGLGLARGIVGAALFLAIFLMMLAFLRDGSVLGLVVWLAAAGLLLVMMAGIGGGRAQDAR